MQSEVKLFAQRLKAIQHFFTRPSRRLITGLIIGGVLFGPGLYDMIHMMARQRKLDRELAVLASRKASLTEEAKRLETDPGYTEGLIRSTFKMALPGELVVPLASKDSQQSSKRLASQ